MTLAAPRYFYASQRPRAALISRAISLEVAWLMRKEQA
jgi:hypothetical protein